MPSDMVDVFSDGQRCTCNHVCVSQDEWAQGETCQHSSACALYEAPALPVSGSDPDPAGSAARRGESGDV